MNVFSLFLAEMAKLAAKKGVLVSVIAALMVPVVYGGILLSPKWGPYDNLSNLPVAVVNNDQGATSGDEPINVGKDLVADLEKSTDLGWKFVDSQEAQKGLDSFKYYMVIEIPEDFSQRVASVLDSDPKVPELNYIQNEGLNFMAAQVTRSATEKIREKLANKITENYTTNVFNSLSDVSDGFQKAADGSQQLNDGAGQLQDGTTQLLQSLTEKSGDISKLADGANELENGTGQLLGSLSSKQSDITKLANGSNELKAGTGQLLSSLNEKSGDIKRLADGSAAANAGTGLLLQKLKEGQPKIQLLAQGGKDLSQKAPLLYDGTQQVLKGLQDTKNGLVHELKPKTEDLARGVTLAVDNLSGVSAALQGYLPAIQKYVTEPTEENKQVYLTAIGTLQQISDELNLQTNKDSLATLKAGAAALPKTFEPGGESGKIVTPIDALNGLIAGQTEINNGVKELAAKAPALAEGTSELNSKWDELITNVGTLHAGTTQIAGGTKTVETGWTTMTAGVTKLDSGAGQIATGNATVDSGWRQLTSGASQIHSGTVQVSDGTDSVEKGWGDLTEGVTKLNDGAGKLNDGSSELASGLKDGAEQTSSIKAEDDNIGMFASPVELISDKVHGYEHYRDSTAPYVITLALFVGILIMSLFINFRRPEDVSAISWFGAKFLNLAALAVGQALLLSTVVLLFLNVDVQNLFGFVFFAVVASIVFSGIVLFFASLGNIGRLLALAFVVLQLSTTGANLPIDMLPEYLRTLSDFLPFTYSIAGFKSLMTLGDFGTGLTNLAILLGYLIIFATLALLVFFMRSKGEPQQTDLAV
ncbi:YhgE/Pip family protein [Bacillus sp. T33-2]|uniref:YhgE/Pip family protein n=1 Tax=Bacillus sp. T33-2 TaxID=2054168 RepID=UPI000C77DA39|nr:YhgE/Pip domain-containing protein [Bacillus sp. T33-2]PLR97868.1 hypothetical protein CVD19_06945 [Bacillus sp. T33-2]